MYVLGCWILRFQKIDGRATVDRVFRQEIALDFVSFKDSSLSSCGALDMMNTLFPILSVLYVEARIVVLFLRSACSADNVLSIGLMPCQKYDWPFFRKRN